ERALGEAQEVWTEIDMDPAKEAAMQGLVMRYGIDTTRPLSSKVTPARWTQIQAAAASYGMAAANLEPMKPWLASLTFSIMPMMKAGYDPNAGVDRAIDRIARAGGKTMRAFETSEQQLQFFSTFSEEMQVQMLYESLDEMEKGVEALTAMETAWEKGDDRALATEMVAEMARDYPQLYDVLLKRRNSAWVETLSNELKGSGVDFVAVGAAHLAGPDSVQALLGARNIPGVTVTRVTPAPY
ncbi:MAG: TraB/GumN family protein, partial [Alphaproteobacteria bacterium]|nr:TraB/GumN family protein [Alphaproteobacteria bacterium]